MICHTTQLSRVTATEKKAKHPVLGGELPAFALTSHGYNQPFFRYANAQNKIAASEIKRKSEPLSFSFAPEVVLIPRLTATCQHTR